METAVSLKAQFSDAPMGSSIGAGLTIELANLQVLYDLPAAWWQGQAQRITGRTFPAWNDIQSMTEETRNPLAQSQLELKRLISACLDWRDKAESLIRFHRQFGSGLFARYLAFRWEGCLRGVEQPDPIRLEDLVGYGRQRNEVVDNTVRLLSGLRANNVLLYGDRGTGKSSTVKALIHRFGLEGLRLIEVPKNRLADFPAMIDLLKDRPQKFILFIDDLSFEDGEESYKEMKALLEGGVAVRPDNVVIYATSNRRHLIKETFADRQVTLNEADELHPGDTYQEKMSLADRFGITVTFLAPGQEAYLEIVETLAEQRGIEMERETLRRQALLWEQRHNGRSGRTARQFVDSLIR
ncbi:ATP-binding protein [Heliobacterium chlorum]|uniref:ATP-binding protein n=2 Tax=Heliobacterium chlorum TaxID=2698 RepID=A0ABR7T270_HELCL|nr:ATP-binding protein [Heliobacterium chlorum]